MASLLGQREDSHSGQMGSTGEGLGLNQLPPPSAPANLGQDLPSLAHLENSGVMRVLGGPPLEEGKRKDKVKDSGLVEGSALLN